MNCIILSIALCIYSDVFVKSSAYVYKKGDPRDWLEDRGYDNYEKPNLAKFNSLVDVNSICSYEDNLRDDVYCFKQCSKDASSLSYPDLCLGNLRYCRFVQRDNEWETSKNIWLDLQRSIGLGNNDTLKRQIDQARNTLQWQGDRCFCMCERNEPDSNQSGDKLLDSICFDPALVPNTDPRFVVTGARFKRHGNIIYLELQSGKLSNGRAVDVRWSQPKNCTNVSKVLYNFRKDDYDGLKFLFEDMTLPKHAVLTGVTLGKSISGRYINANGNIIMSKPEFTINSKCHESTTDLMQTDLRPSTVITGSNYERSESCKNHVTFRVSGSINSHLIFPYVDLQEITNSHVPITGIGWYYRGFEGYGGFLALKFFES